MQSSSGAFSCFSAVALKLAARTVRAVRHFGILQFSQGKQVFRKTPNILQHDFGSVPRDQTGTLQNQTRHKADLIPFEKGYSDWLIHSSRERDSE
jgi:hypothetical protein